MKVVLISGENYWPNLKDTNKVLSSFKKFGVDEILYNNSYVNTSFLAGIRSVLGNEIKITEVTKDVLETFKSAESMIILSEPSVNVNRLARKLNLEIICDLRNSEEV